MKVIGYFLGGGLVILILWLIFGLGRKYSAVKHAIQTIKPTQLGACKVQGSVKVIPATFEIYNGSSSRLTIDYPSVTVVGLNGILIAQSAPPNTLYVTIPADTKQSFSLDLVIRNQDVWDKDCKVGIDLNKLEAIFYISTLWNHLEFEKTFNPQQQLFTQS